MTISRPRRFPPHEAAAGHLLRSRPFDTDMREVMTRSVDLVDEGEREVAVGDTAGRVDTGNGVPA